MNPSRQKVFREWWSHWLTSLEDMVVEVWFLWESVCGGERFRVGLFLVLEFSREKKYWNRYMLPR